MIPLPANGLPVVLINNLAQPPGEITGITRYCFGLTEALVRRDDVKVVLVTTWAEEQLPPAIAGGVVAVVRLPYVRRAPADNVRQRLVLPGIARKYGVDVVYAMSATCPPVRGVRSVITVHDLYFDVSPNLYKRRHRLWWKLFFSDAARRAACIATVSRSTAADLHRHHASLDGKVRIVAGAGVLPRGDAQLPHDLAGPPYVLLLGNAAPNKNLGFAVDALRLLSRQGRSIRALHVGRDLTGHLADALSDDGAKVLESLGALDDAELDAVLRNAAVLVQPSRYEGFGLPIIEAQARGVPVIASDIAVFREVAGEGCIFVGVDDAPRLAEALHSVTTDHSLRERLSAKAVANSAMFSWDKSAQAAAAIVVDLAGQTK